MEKEASVATRSWRGRKHGTSLRTTLHTSTAASLISIYAARKYLTEFMWLRLQRTQWYLVSPARGVGSNYASCQAKALGKAAIGGQMPTSDLYRLPRSSSLSLSLCPLAYSSLSHLTIIILNYFLKANKNLGIILLLVCMVVFRCSAVVRSAFCAAYVYGSRESNSWLCLYMDPEMSLRDSLRARYVCGDCLYHVYIVGFPLTILYSSF